MADGTHARGKVIAIFLLTGMAPALAVDRTRLDRCQETLGACYDACKAQDTAPRDCNEKCSTDRCGLPWKESYGAFLDRRIEENAVGTRNRFIGLKQQKRRRRHENRYQPEQPTGDEGFFSNLWPFSRF